MDRQREKGIRLILDIAGTKRKLARFVTRENDGSFYIIPFSLHGKYRGKIARLGNAFGSFETEIDYSGTEVALDKGAPHISIHQSGQVRGYINRGMFFGEVQSISPTLLVNQHIASLSMDSFESLPELVGDIQQDDVVQKVDPSVPGLRFQFMSIVSTKPF